MVVGFENGASINKLQKLESVNKEIPKAGPFYVVSATLASLSIMIMAQASVLGRVCTTIVRRYGHAVEGVDGGPGHPQEEAEHVLLQRIRCHKAPPPSEEDTLGRAGDPHVNVDFSRVRCGRARPQRRRQEGGVFTQESFAGGEAAGGPAAVDLNRSARIAAP